MENAITMKNNAYIHDGDADGSFSNSNLTIAKTTSFVIHFYRKNVETSISRSLMPSACWIVLI